jgi:isopenicillin-N epimerase
LLVTNHEYNACRNALDAVADSTGATVVEAEVPFPLRSADEAVDAVVSCLSTRTRLLLVDHVTSQTGMVLPLKRITDEAISSGAEVLVDGAHAPGMIDLDLEYLGATYYTGNCHKWMCAPKGAGFLYVREDRQKEIRPLVISHGANAAAGARSRFHLEHDWTGTRDPSAWLAVSSAIRAMGSMLPGGWKELRERNRDLALAGRRVLCEALEIDPPCPEPMIGSLASVPLPDGEGENIHELFPFDALQTELFTEYRIEVPVIEWPARPKRLLRISAQLYNTLDQYVYLAKSLKDLLT